MKCAREREQTLSKRFHCPCTSLARLLLCPLFLLNEKNHISNVPATTIPTGELKVEQKSQQKRQQQPFLVTFSNRQLVLAAAVEVVQCHVDVPQRFGWVVAAVVALTITAADAAAKGGEQILLRRRK